ncbi:MAG: TIGR04283 family arsenosugar biosynthesis glycosyltransferase [Planctomycetes bacterium]|nr:TIGR04283 family arsenosugar biosynthesis glycosyltransferase [Planctomycetota bacterium]
MRISVIIPAVDEEALIERAVTSSWEAGVDEVLVVDGDSRDQTAQRARRHDAQVISGPLGRALQQNLGAQHATGDVLLFLHADNWLDPRVGSQLRDCLQDASVLGGAFRQQIDAAGRLYRWLERGNAARVRWRGLAYGDQAIFMRREVFDELGGFPTVKLMEDLLLMRAFRKLTRPVLLPGPVHVDPRRWQRRGVVRQTLCNWALLSARAVGVSPDRLARFYPLHDRPSA